MTGDHNEMEEEEGQGSRSEWEKEKDAQSYNIEILTIILDTYYISEMNIELKEHFKFS